VTRTSKDAGAKPPPERVTPAYGVPQLGKGTRRDVSESAAAAREAVADPAAARDEHIAALAHDLRNPLGNIVMDVALLAELLVDETSPVVQRSLRRLAQNADFMDAMLRELLDLDRLETGRLELHCMAVDLAHVVANAVDRVAPSYDRDRLVLDLGDGAVAMVDRVRIERVVENLIRNALKYAPGAPVIVRLEVRGSRACVSVIDRGAGLSVEQARHVFDRHWRGSGIVAGSGLGLHISRKIVEAHGGRMGVESAPGRGSRFFFDLPGAGRPSANPGPR
jgi:signal transduction histidine kinase